MKILISGIGGHMGQTVARMCLQKKDVITEIFGVDPNGDFDGVQCFHSFKEINCEIDGIIDFSHHSVTDELLSFALKNKLPTVIATTGQTEEEAEKIAQASKQIPIFRSANMSLGIALLKELARIAARMMPNAEIEIIEKHHDRKLDAPSGTALLLADAIKEVRPQAQTVCGRSGMGKRTKEEIGIHAIRMGNIVGEHEVLIGTDNQTISLKHSAHDRALFAEGAISAMSFLLEKSAGLYSMDDLVKESAASI